MESNVYCIVCHKSLHGKQRSFCSRKCKNQSSNVRCQNYFAQQARGLERKRKYVALAGGGCKRCGYSKNLAALAWHHVKPREKNFNLDLRALSNRAEAQIISELAKCVLLCANCHAEEHFPELVNLGP